jgi:alginate O-acetyltransferase complex protein AlgI
VVFSSVTFVSVFLPLTFLAYLAMPGAKAKNGLLILASLVFYAYGEPVYVVLMLVSALANWGFGVALGRQVKDGTPQREKARKLTVAAAVAVNLGFLGVFKYARLLAQTGAVFGLNLSGAGLALPIGISFYTFQALSYVIDVYRGETEAQRSFPRVLLYIAFFPQLIAGPIIKYHDVEAQLAARTVTLDGVAAGLRRFAVGLGKKVLIANTLGATADAVWAAPHDQVGIAAAWIGALAYVGQIYFDFSGYSDMAIGLARMFGFHYKENFNYPYISTSVQEFWRRWHISLSTWFRDYLYIPLGGNRKGRHRAVLNKLIVFALCGLWHGAAWTFLAWGLFHGLFLLLEEYVPALRKLPKSIGWLYTFLVVTVGFTLFRSATFADAAFMLGQMFAGFGTAPIATARALWMLDPVTLTVFAVAIAAATPVGPWLKEKCSLRGGDLGRVARPLAYAGAFALAVLALLALAPGGYNPFIYFRF